MITMHLRQKIKDVSTAGFSAELIKGGCLVMNKTELISAVAQTAEMTKKDSEKAVKAVIDVISQALVKGDKVQLIGFGTFEVRQRKAREGHNPATQKAIKIPASKSPAWRVSKQLKERVNSKKAAKKAKK